MNWIQWFSAFMVGFIIAWIIQDIKWKKLIGWSVVDIPKEEVR